MGRRSILPSFQVLTNQDSASSFQSEPSEVEGVDTFAYDITVGASVNGSMTIQYCNERNESDYDWKDIDFGETTSLNGGTETNYRFEIKNSFKRVRLSWVNNAGTGNINAKIYGMTVGA